MIIKSLILGGNEGTKQKRIDFFKIYLGSVLQIVLSKDSSMNIINQWSFNIVDIGNRLTIGKSAKKTIVDHEKEYQGYTYTKAYSKA